MEQVGEVFGATIGKPQETKVITPDVKVNKILPDDAKTEEDEEEEAKKQALKDIKKDSE